MTEPRLNQTREDQAREELGHTQMPRWTGIVLTLVFLATIASVPLIQTGWELYAHQLPADHADHRAQPWPLAFEVFRQSPTLPNLQAYETKLEDASIINRYLLPWMQGHVLTPLGVGNEQAYIGRDGWLFYADGVDYVTGRGFLDPDVLLARRRAGDASVKAIQPDPVLAITDFDHQLRDRGITLLVIPTPVKVQLHPEHLSRGYTSAHEPLNNVSYARFIRRLKKEGVAIFDPLPVLSEAKRSRDFDDVYLRTDTHWTPDAMQRVAEELATAIGAMNGLALKPAEVDYRTEGQAITSPGDILQMLKLPEDQQLFEQQTVQVRRVLPMAEEQAAVWDWVTVEATVKQVAPAPAKDQAYDEARMGIVLQELKAEGAQLPDEILVYMLGMRDWKHLWPTTLRPGDRVTLRIAPWGQAQARYGTLVASEVGGDADFLDAFWGERLEDAKDDTGEGRWLPDPESEILVLGDSFSNIYSGADLRWGESAGLVEQLSHTLRRPLDRIVVNGNGAFATREALQQAMRRGENRLAGKKLVIWQFAARELAVGDWRLIDLPSPADGAARSGR